MSDRSAQPRNLQAAILTMLVALASTPAGAEIDARFAPIYLDGSEPGVFYLVGELDRRTPLLLRRAMDTHGVPFTLVLNSPGGDLHAALAMALEIDRHPIRTIVVDACFSACVFLFAAGERRELDGKLGVHQITSESGDLEAGQVAIADIVDVMKELGMDMDILMPMLSTPPSKMHVFTEEEIRRYGLETGPSPLPDPPGRSSVRYPGWDVTSGVNLKGADLTSDGIRGVSLGPVDKRDSQIGIGVIQDSFREGGCLGAALHVGCGMDVLRAIHQGHPPTQRTQAGRPSACA